MQIVTRLSSTQEDSILSSTSVTLLTLGLEGQLPVLSSDVRAKHLVRNFLDEFEALPLVDTARVHQNVVGPEAQRRVPAGTGESDALIDKAIPQPQPARRRLDEQQSQLRDVVRLLHAEDRPDDLAIALGDPAALPGGVEVADEIGDDSRHEPLEAFVPAVLLEVERTVPVHDPPHVSRAMHPQRVRFRASHTLICASAFWSGGARYRQITSKS